MNLPMTFINGNAVTIKQVTLSLRERIFKIMTPLLFLFPQWLYRFRPPGFSLN